MSVHDTTTRAADLIRDHLLLERGVDLEPHGVRENGPLAWDPRAPDRHRPLERVEIARARILARRRVAAELRRCRELRGHADFWRAA